MRERTRPHEAIVIHSSTGYARSDDIGRNAVLRPNKVGGNRLRIETGDEEGGDSGRVYYMNITSVSY